MQFSPPGFCNVDLEPIENFLKNSFKVEILELFNELPQSDVVSLRKTSQRVKEIWQERGMTHTKRPPKTQERRKRKRTKDAEATTDDEKSQKVLITRKLHSD